MPLSNPSGKHVRVIYTQLYPTFIYSKTGVCRWIPIFLVFDPKQRLWVLVRTASAFWSFEAKIRKYVFPFSKVGFKGIGIHFTEYVFLMLAWFQYKNILSDHLIFFDLANDLFYSRCDLFLKIEKHNGLFALFKSNMRLMDSSVNTRSDHCSMGLAVIRKKHPKQPCQKQVLFLYWDQ